MTVLLTGASGFVGGATQRAAAARGVPVRAALRTGSAGSAPSVQVGDIHGGTDWGPALEGITTVIHLAARVHVMHETAADALSEFRRVNTAGTERLARAAAAAGAKRFVYVSSIKVNGEATTERPFASSDSPDPKDPYGISKHEAEQALWRVATETGLEVVVLRPPLVYGPGVRGNFLRLLQLVRSGLPLPFGRAKNLRSLVFVGNLADALVTCALHPKAPGKTFLASDGDDLSTAALCQRIALALDRRPRLVPIPLRLLESAAALARRTPEYQRLFGSLQVDSSPLRTDLGWAPPFTVDQGLRDTATWFRHR